MGPDDDLEALPSALYVFVDEDDHTVLAALQEGGAGAPLSMLAVDEDLLPRYVRLAQAYGQREGHRYRLFKFSSCVEVDMDSLAPARQRPALHLVSAAPRGSTEAELLDHRPPGPCTRH